MIIWLAVSNFANLLGVAPDSPLRWLAPAVFPVVALLGINWALVLRRRRPDTYARIGLGAASAAAAVKPEAPASMEVNR